MYLVTDLDGTVCNIQHRVDYAKTGQWEEFHRRSPGDGLYPDVMFILQCASEMGATILAVTGCNERFRQLRLDWLSKHKVPVDEIIMRPDNNFEHDAELKLRMLEDYFNGDKDAVLREVCLCLDDRDKVVEAFRNYGLLTWQVRQGDY